MEVTFISEKVLLQKEHFLAKKHCLLGDLHVHFEPLLGQECKYRCHDKRNEKTEFRIKSPNTKKAIRIEVISITEMKLQEEYFVVKRHCFLGNLHFHFEPLLGWECKYVCQEKRTEKEAIQEKQPEYRKSNWRRTDLHHRNEASKKNLFLLKNTVFQSTQVSIFNPC